MTFNFIIEILIFLVKISYNNKNFSTKKLGIRNNLKKIKNLKKN